MRERVAIFKKAIQETHSLDDAKILSNDRGLNCVTDLNAEAWHDARIESGREQ
jgi:hypothetical protein|tara:strand:+ start:1702 stop:1860 length:159 start_codon:yes stop_codon:yes gene_type:complete